MVGSPRTSPIVRRSTGPWCCRLLRYRGPSRTSTGATALSIGWPSSNPIAPESDEECRTSARSTRGD
jgi:hypothetical protein